MTQFGRTSIRDSFSHRPAPEGSTKPKIVEYSTFQYTTKDGTTVTRQHNTDIVHEKDVKYTLDTGGWLTKTTKDRLNRYTPFGIYSKKGIWYVWDREGDREVPYYDGMVLPDALAVTNTKLEKQQRALGRKIKKFCDQVDTIEELPLPSGGDCWICMMFNKDEKKVKDPTCLEEHLKENYLHGTLLWNAMRWAGHDEQSIGLHFTMPYRDSIKRALRRYMRRQLGLTA